MPTPFKRPVERPPVRGPESRANRKKLWLIVGASVAALVLLGGVIGSVVAGGVVRGKLERIAKEANLRLELTDVSVSMMGRVQIQGLAFVRADNSKVVAVESAEAKFSFLRILAGRRRPQSADLKGFLIDVVVDDGKPKEMLDLYRAARTVFPRKEKEDDKDDEKSTTASAFSIERGQIALRVRGKGSEYLPQGLRIRDIAAHVDLNHDVGDLTAVVDGSVASKLTASMVAQKEGPPRLQARFAPEFRLKVPATSPLPLGADSLSVGGFGFDAVEGGAVEDVVLRKGDQVLLSVRSVRPDSVRGLGVTAEDIAFAVPIAAEKPAAPAKKPGKGKAPPPPPAPAAKIWSGKAKSLSLGVGAVVGTELPLVARLEALQVTLPGEIGVLGLAAAELRTDRMPSDKPLESLVLLKIEKPSIDLPWREDALNQVPLGRSIWGAVKAAEEAKLRRQMQGEAEDEIDDPELPPESRRKMVQEKVALKLEQAGVAAAKPAAKSVAKGANGQKSAVANYAEPLKALHAKLLGGEALVQNVIDRMAQAPRLKVEVIGGRVGFVQPGSTQPFGGVSDITVQWTPVLADGTRGLTASAKPFDAERVWGELSADVVTGPGAKLDRAKFKMAGSQFAQALRVVSSGVSVAEDSDLSANLEVRLGAGPSLNITGDLLLKKVGVDWWRLAPEPVDLQSVTTKMQLTASAADGSIRLELPDLKIGDAQMRVLLEATDVTNKPIVHARAEMARQDCGAVARSIPKALLTSIGAIEATGQVSWMVDLAVPLKDVYKATMDLTLDDATCEVSKFANIDLDELAGDFVRPVNENGTMLDDVLVGPQSGYWVALADMPPWLPWSMMATEDGAFYKHRGIRPGLLLRAIRMDLDYGRFVYGGSTITQQLVKNVYLSRAKHLSRKFEELLIVWQLERRVPKDRILELYVNMIEYGPKIYGIERAAQAYFGKSGKDLSPLESAFLAANKPCPRCGYARFTKKQWDPWWQERMIGIMNKMRDEGVIDDEKYLAEAPYVPKFLGWPAPVAAEPGAPLGGVAE
jgi:hypothetical protein